MSTVFERAIPYQIKRSRRIIRDIFYSPTRVFVYFFPQTCSAAVVVAGVPETHLRKCHMQATEKRLTHDSPSFRTFVIQPKFLQPFATAKSLRNNIVIKIVTILLLYCCDYATLKPCKRVGSDNTLESSQEQQGTGSYGKHRAIV